MVNNIIIIGWYPVYKFQFELVVTSRNLLHIMNIRLDKLASHVKNEFFLVQVSHNIIIYIITYRFHR